jgi:hypothetical protein
VPQGIGEIVVLVPLPLLVDPPGFCVIVQLPVEGNPLSTTLPVETAHVVCVTVPTTGGCGDGGRGLITAFEDEADVHPASVVTVKVKVPEGRPVTIVVVPIPFTETLSGLLVRVQITPEGKPVSTTLPISPAHERPVTVPITGAAGTAFTFKE